MTAPPALGMPATQESRSPPRHRRWNRIWSTHAQTAIEQSFQRYGAALPDAVLLDTECRTTLCRMEVAFETDAARNAVLMRLPHMIPWNSHGLLHVDEDQNGALLSCRKGERLTPPDRAGRGTGRQRRRRSGAASAGGQRANR